MTSALTVYLRDHAAAALGGLDLFTRAARNQRQRPHGAEFARLRADVADDVDTLYALLKELKVRPSIPLGLAVRVGERLGRLKPNGQLLGRTATADLVEVEGCLVAVVAKAAGWQSLKAADLGLDDELDVLAERAADQLERLQRLHRQTAAGVLRG